MIDIDTGDTVFHRPTRETWTVAYARDAKVAWCGWPRGVADIRDCLLVLKATQHEREALLSMCIFDL